MGDQNFSTFWDSWSRGLLSAKLTLLTRVYLNAAGKIQNLLLQKSCRQCIATSRYCHVGLNQRHWNLKAKLNGHNGSEPIQWSYVMYMYLKWTIAVLCCESILVKCMGQLYLHPQLYWINGFKHMFQIFWISLFVHKWQVFSGYVNWL